MNQTLEPMEHQEALADLMLQDPRHNVFWECGTGKTIGILLGIERLYKQHGKFPVLVVCPAPLVRSAWLEDSQFFPDLDVVPCHGIPAAKRKQILKGGNYDVLVTSFETFRNSKKIIDELPFEMLVVDESSKIKNFKSKISSAIIDTAKRTPMCYLLTGSPAPNGPNEYWPQIKCVRPEDALRTFWQWATLYCVPIKQTVRGRTVVKRWEKHPTRWDEMGEKMKEYSWFLKADECIDLPPHSEIPRIFSLSRDEWRKYDTAENEFRIELQSQSRAINPAGQLMKLRQLTSGFVYIDGRAYEYGNSRVQCLQEILEEIGPLEKVVIWAEFTHDIDRAATLATIMGREPKILDGRTTPTVKTQAIRSFQGIETYGQREVNTLVCHPASVGHGVTLNATRYAIFFNQSFSYEQYEQARHRIHRKGQERKCFSFFVMADETIDLMIRRALRNKQKVSDAVLESLRSEGEDLGD